MAMGKQLGPLLFSCVAGPAFATIILLCSAPVAGLPRGSGPRARPSPTFGFLWGLSQVTLGLSFAAVGVALAFSIMAGLCTLTGSLIPLLAFSPGDLFRPRGLLLLVSIPILMVGLWLYARAGLKREQEQSSANERSERPKVSFAKGLALCIFTGIFGSNVNFRFRFWGRSHQEEPRPGRQSDNLDLCSVGSGLLGGRDSERPVLLVSPLPESQLGFVRGGWPR